MPRPQKVNRRERGFLTFAFGGEDHIRRAYMLALSISASQERFGHTTVCIGPNTSMPNRYARAFDNIVEIPYPSGQRWSVADEWNSIHASPYEKTIKLDNDMILMRDISSWWDLLDPEDVSFAIDDSLPDSYEHKAFFDRNRLPIVNPSFQYFNRSRFTFGVFHYLSGLGRCWEEITSGCLVDAPMSPDLRMLWSVTMRLMDVVDQRRSPTRVPRVFSIDGELTTEAFLGRLPDRAPIHYGRSNTPTADEFNGYQMSSPEAWHV